MTYEWIRAAKQAEKKPLAQTTSAAASPTTSFPAWYRENFEAIASRDLADLEQEQLYSASLRSALVDGNISPSELLKEVARILPHFDQKSLGKAIGEPSRVSGLEGERGLGFRQKYEHGEVAFFLASGLNEGTVRFFGTSNASRPPALPEVEVFRPATWLQPDAKAIQADRFELKERARRVGWRPPAAQQTKKPVIREAKTHEVKQRPVGWKPPKLKVSEWKPKTEAVAKPKSPWNTLRFGNAPIPQSHADLKANILRPGQKQIDLRLAGDKEAEQGGVVTAPTGYGKTLIGAARVEDWLRQMKAGESVLIVAPSPAVAEQWRHALCYQTWTSDQGDQTSKQIGMHLPSSRVFIGTPMELFRAAKRNPGAPRPAVVILNAAGLERAARSSANESVEPFIRALGTSRVIIDEIHQWVGNEGSAYHRVIQELKSLAGSGRVKSMIELTGTAFSVRDQLEALGLPIVANIEPKDLIPTGFVPPHSARAAISTLSPSEEVIHEGLLELKGKLSNLLKSLDTDRLRERFAAIYKEDPEGLVRVLGDDLEKYVGSDEQRRRKILTRISKLITGGDGDEPMRVDMRQLDLLIGIQIHDQLTDSELFHQFARPDQLKAIDAQLSEAAQSVPVVRERVEKQIKVAEYSELFKEAWGGRPNATNIERRAELGKTLAGTYETLSRYRQHFGLGLAESILTIHREESRARSTVLANGAASPLKTMVFARPQNLNKLEEQATIDLYPDSAPGLVLGASLQAKGKLGAVAVQTQQAIIPEADSKLRGRIVDHVVKSVLKGELANAAVNELMAELPWKDAQSGEPELRTILLDRVSRYVDGLMRDGSARLGTHNFPRFCAAFSSDDFASIEAPVRAALIAKLTPKTHTVAVNARVALNGIVSDLIGWTAAALRVRDAEVYTGRTVGGDQVRFAMVPFGKDASIMRSVFARAFDAADVGIDLAVFTEGSTTGMDIRSPAVAISADGVANKKSLMQRFGRVLRTDPAFQMWHSALLGKVLGTAGLGKDAFGKIDPALLERVLALAPGEPPASRLNEREARFVAEAIAAVDATWKPATAILNGDLRAASDDDRARIATDVLLYANKVAHYYEVHEFRRGSVSPELMLKKGVLGRTDASEAKFETMTLVGPDGRVSTGADRVPILNPSVETTPAKLAAILRSTLPEQLRKDVAGWLEGTRPSGQKNAA